MVIDDMHDHFDILSTSLPGHDDRYTLSHPTKMLLEPGCFLVIADMHDPPTKMLLEPGCFLVIGDMHDHFDILSPSLPGHRRPLHTISSNQDAIRARVLLGHRRPLHILVVSNQDAIGADTLPGHRQPLHALAASLHSHLWNRCLAHCGGAACSCWIRCLCARGGPACAPAGMSRRARAPHPTHTRTRTRMHTPKTSSRRSLPSPTAAVPAAVHHGVS